jgi:hypothetical protein
MYVRLLLDLAAMSAFMSAGTGSFDGVCSRTCTTWAAGSHISLIDCAVESAAMFSSTMVRVRASIGSRGSACFRFTLVFSGFMWTTSDSSTASIINATSFEIFRIFLNDEITCISQPQSDGVAA